MLDTIHLKSQVIEHDESSRLRRPVQRLESRVSGMLIHVMQPCNSKLILAF